MYKGRARYFPYINLNFCSYLNLKTTCKIIIINSSSFS